MHRSRLPFSLMMTLLVACAGDTPSERDDFGYDGTGIQFNVAPLTLASLSDACYSFAVVNGSDELVVGRGPEAAAAHLDGDGQSLLTGSAAISVCASRFGNSGGGDIAYVTPCDAQETPEGNALHTVTLWVDRLCTTGTGPECAVELEGWVDPCANGCNLEVACVENADVPVTFNLTIMSPARQGFFDLAINFDDVFCSAKLDTCYGDTPVYPGDAITMLFDEDGQRQHTAVAAVACTGGPGNDIDTTLYHTLYVVECGDPANPTLYSLDLTQVSEEGNLATDFAGPTLGTYDLGQVSDPNSPAFGQVYRWDASIHDVAERFYEAPAQFQALTAAVYFGTTLQTTTTPSGLMDANVVYTNVAFLVPPDVPEGCTVKWAVVPTEGPPPAPPSNAGGLYENVASIDFEALVKKDACHQHPMWNASFVRLDGAVVAKDFGTARRSTVDFEEAPDVELTEEEKRQIEERRKAIAERSRAVKSTLISGYGVGLNDIVEVDKADQQRDRSSRVRAVATLPDVDDRVASLGAMEYVGAFGATFVAQTDENGKIRAVPVGLKELADPKAGVFAIGDVGVAERTGAFSAGLPKRNGSDRMHIDLNSGLPRTFHGFMFGGDGERAMRDVDALVFHGVRDHEELQKRIVGISLAPDLTPLGRFFSERLLSVRLEVDRGAPIVFTDVIPMKGVTEPDEGEAEDAAWLSEATRQAVSRAQAEQWVRLQPQEAGLLFKSIPPWSFAVAHPAWIPRDGRIDSVKDRSYTTVAMGPIYLGSGDFSSASFAAGPEAFAKSANAFSLADPRAFAGAKALSPAPSSDKPSGQATMTLPLKRPDLAAAWVNPQYVEVHGFGHGATVAGEDADKLVVPDFANLRDVVSAFNGIEVQFALNAGALSQAIPGARAYSVRLRIGPFTLDFVDVVVEHDGGKLTTSADTRLGDATKEAQPISGDLGPVPKVDVPRLGFGDIEAILGALEVRAGRGGFGDPYRIEFGDDSDLARFVEGFFAFEGCGGLQCAFLAVCEPETATCVCDRGLVEHAGDCVDPSELNPRQTLTNGACSLSGEFRTDGEAMWPRSAVALPFGVARVVSPEKMSGFGLEIETHAGAHRLVAGAEFQGFGLAGGAEVVADPEQAVMHFVVRGTANESTSEPSRIRVFSTTGTMLAELGFSEARRHVLQIAVSLVDTERNKVATWRAVGEAMDQESLANFLPVARIVDIAGSVAEGQSWLDIEKGRSHASLTVVRNGLLCTTIRCTGPCRLGATPWDGGGDMSSPPTALAVVCADSNGNRNLQAMVTAGSEDWNHGIDAVMLGASSNGLVLVANAGGSDLRLNPQLGPENTLPLAPTEGSPWVIDLANPFAPQVFRIGRQIPASAKEVEELQDAWVEAYSAAVVADSILVVGRSGDDLMAEVPFAVRVGRGAGGLAQEWSHYGEYAGTFGYAAFDHVVDLGEGRIGISARQQGPFRFAGLTIGRTGMHLPKANHAEPVATSAVGFEEEAHVVTLAAVDGEGIGAVATGRHIWHLVGDKTGGAYVAFDGSGGRFGDNRLESPDGGYVTTKLPGIGRVDGPGAAWMASANVSDSRDDSSYSHLGGLLAVPGGVRIDFGWQSADTIAAVPAYPSADGDWGIPLYPKDPLGEIRPRPQLPTFGTGIEAPTPMSFTGHVTLGIAGPCGCDGGEAATTTALQTSYTMCGSASWDAGTGEWSCNRGGFDFVAGSSSVCVDVDECAGVTSACLGANTLCYNEVGSFRCECRPGYQAGNGDDCVDIDECADVALNACAAGASCQNAVAGYTCDCTGGACECPAGAWQLDGTGAKCDTIVDIATAGEHACALSRMGLVACWGNNEKSVGAIGAPMPSFDGRDMWNAKQGVAKDAQAAANEDAIGMWPWLQVATPYHIPLPGAARAIAAGEGASCAIVGPTNQAWCWGAGVNANERYWEPAAVSGWTGVQAIAVGSGEVCAILGDGGVLDCRSSGLFGRRHGSGETPTLVGCDALSVDGGSYFARCNGEWLAWGENGSGQLGTGGSSSSDCSFRLCKASSFVLQPTVVPGDWDFIRTHGDMTCGVGVAADRDDAEAIHCWGYVPHNGQGNWTQSHYWTAGEGPVVAAPTGRTWKDFDVTWNAVCATDSAGNVACAGGGEWLPPVVNGEPWTARPIPELGGVVATKVASNNGMLWSIASGKLQVISKFGGEWERTLGAQGGPAAGATLQDATRPWVSVAVGWGNHVCGIDADARLWCRGENWSGQLGQGYTGSWVGGLLEVEPPEGVDGWLDVSLGSAHVCAIAANRRLYCWGNNGSGQLGDSSWGWHSSPFDVFATGNATGAFANASAHSVSVGLYHSCAVIDIDGAAGVLKAEAYCWGDNGNGRLGLGSSGGRNVPTRVNHPGTGARPGAHFARVETGAYHTVFVDDEGAAWGAGDNGQGQLGVGFYGHSGKWVDVQHCTCMPNPSDPQGPCMPMCWTSQQWQTDFGPFPVVNVSDVIAVATAWSATCLQMAGGRIACTGDSYGALPDWWGTIANPVEIDLPFDVSAMSLHGSNLACVLSVDGDVACAGSFGDHQQLAPFEPIEAFGGRSWSGLVVRDNTVLAISDGAVFGAGSNPTGLFGTEHGFMGPALFACHVDNLGKSHCFDPPGLVCDLATRLCTDRDECAEGTDTCSEGRACANSSGGFACFCANGSDDGAGGCNEVDWATAVVCGEADGIFVDPDVNGFRCTCEGLGKTYRAWAQTCDDTNECLQDEGICGSDARCENRVMSDDDAPEGYLCHCDRRGFRWDDMNGCVDVDECTEGTSGCDASALCTNEPGGYACACPEGSTDVNGDGSLCEPE